MKTEWQAQESVFTEHVLCAGHFTRMDSSDPSSNPMRWEYYYAHLTDKNTEAQSG